MRLKEGRSFRAHQVGLSFPPDVDHHLLPLLSHLSYTSMKLAPVPPEDLFIQSTLISLYSGPSAPALRSILLSLSGASSLYYILLYKTFLPGSPSAPITILILALWVAIFFLSVAHNRYVTLPFLVKAKQLKPSPDEQWFQARTLSSMAECLGFAIGGVYLVRGCFFKEQSTLYGFFLGWLPVAFAALMFASESVVLLPSFLSSPPRPA